ncbi:unnamed protein product, partial [Phaeothamnion confervicola]
ANALVYGGGAATLHYRLATTGRPEVYNIIKDVLASGAAGQWEELPAGLGLKATWNLLWTWSRPRIDYGSLLTWQKVNHFPSSRELTRKDLLSRHLARAMGLSRRCAHEFYIMPRTFILPHDFTAFVAAFSRESDDDLLESAADAGGGADGGSGETWPSAERASHGAGGTSRAKKRSGGFWIMKPVGMSRGRGIQLVNDIGAVTYSDKVVLQRYLSNPLLLDGYKFDLRLYVLVTSFRPLEAFVHREGFARLSTQRYSGDARHISNLFMHLTNSSIQKLNEEGAQRDNPVRTALTGDAGGTKVTLSYLWRRLRHQGVDTAALWLAVCGVVVKALVCVEPAIPAQPNR